MKWPPDYREILQERQRRLQKLRKDPVLLEKVKLYYKNNRPIEFIEDWGITYNPKNAPKGKLTHMPFILFPRQKEAVNFVMECYQDQEAGLFEKCRDVGLTWIGVAISDYLWRFHDGVAIGWGSQTQDKVDVLGDPSTIFEKIRIYQDFIPDEFQPKDFESKKHSTFTRVINPDNDSIIKGQIGDNQGRGGRTSIYWCDESAHYEHPEIIQSSLGFNTDCLIDISSVNGTGNLFHRKRESGIIWEPGKKIESGQTRIFIVDWSDDPRKDQEWYDKEKARYERLGISHLFAQEVDRDYAASVEGIIIPQDWVKAAIDAHTKIKFDMNGRVLTALDVADEGGDVNALAGRKGNILGYLDSWGQGDTGFTANKAVSISKQLQAYELQYDCIGVGAGIKAETNRLKNKGKLEKLKIVKWAGSAKPLNPDKHMIAGDKESPLNKDFFKNLKIQAWWNVRGMFERTYKVINDNEDYPKDSLISISSKVKNFHQLVKELSQPVIAYDSNNRLLVDKKPDGTRSPNLADAFVMCFWPVRNINRLPYIGSV